MNIEKVFSTKERGKILREIIFRVDVFGVNEVAKTLGLSKGLVSKYFEILSKEDIIKRKGGKFIVLDNNTVKSLRIMLNILKINTGIFKKHSFVKAAGLYGSCVKGTNTRDSDVDLWIKIDSASDREVADLTSKLREKIENVKILILDDKKLETLMEKDTVFYHSLFFGSIVIYGQEDEI
jgi:predicted nucleotidyltransferase